MEQVVLHAPDDAAESRNVAAEYAVQVHAAQLVRDADGGAEDFHEQPMVPRILPEFFVDERDVGADQADGFGAHSAQFGMLLQQHEQFEQRRREPRKHLRVRDLEVVAADLKARIDGHRRRALRQNRLAEQLQQHFIEQADVHHGAIVFLHQLLDREREAGILVAEQFRELDLIVKKQPVLAPARQHVQPEAHLPQERLANLELAQLLARKKAVRHQFIKGVGAEMALRHPADGLDVAQPAGTGFHIRFEIVGRIEIAMMALGLLLDLGFEEIERGPQSIRRQRATHAGEQGLRSGEQARLEQGGGDADVGQAFALAIIDRAHAVSHLEADVPEKRQEFLDVRLPVGRIAFRQEHHDVDIGARVQLTAAVTAHRDQRQILGEFSGIPDPCGTQRDIDQARAITHQFLDGFVRDEALFQQFGAAVEHLAEHPGGELAVFERKGGVRQVRPVRGVLQDPAARAHDAAVAAAEAASAPRVSTSNPSSVTSTVCSHCADRD